jgi:pentatricopeptide repeat protein
MMHRVEPFLANVKSYRLRYYTLQQSVEKQKRAAYVIAQQNDLASSLEIFTSLAAEETPNTYVFAALVKSCMKFKQSVEALPLWDQMEKLSVTPDDVLYKLFVKICIETKDVATIRKIFLLMQQLKPTLKVCLF